MNWWHYLLLVNIYLVLFYGFYALLLRKETYFQLNRIYLVSAALLSFLIPLIQSEKVRHLAITEQVRYGIYGGSINIYAYKPVESSPLTIGQVFAWLYLAGIAFLTIRFIIQLIWVNKIINAPAPSSAAYSFFKKISLGEDLVKQDAVMAHEQVHARQWHTLDILLVEAVMIINWFNPVVYLYRFAVKHIHEFIADQQALKVGADKAEYALLLLSQTFSAPSHQLVNPFFTHSFLKQRIIMIQKNKSQRIMLLKYVLSAPLFGLMLILSSATINNSNTIKVINTNANKMFDESAIAINGIADHGKIPGQVIDEPPTTVTGENNNLENDNTVKATEQDTTHDKVYESVTVEPQYQGGIQAFYSFLSKNIKYPADARSKMIQGKVFVGFIIEKDGSLSNITALRGPGNGLNEEAVRVFGLSSRWIPGTQDGKAVRVHFTVPVNFTLNPLVTNIVLHAPNSPTMGVASANGVYSAVEKEPEYPGGIMAFYSFLARTIKYPDDARRDKIQGRVFIQFVVEKDGALTEIKALRGPGHGLDEEAVRAVGLSPQWKPGLQNGVPVRVQFTVPVNFNLGNAPPVIKN